jgi:hypothetical protein
VVAAISAWQIRQAFQMQVSPESTAETAIEERERKDAEKAQLARQWQEERKLAATHEQPKQILHQHDTEQRQAELKLLRELLDLKLQQEVERRLARARRQADQQRRRREAALERKQKEERKLGAARQQAEQRRLRREAKQQAAELRRKQEEERKMTEARQEVERQRILEEARLYFEERLVDQRKLAETQLRKALQQRAAEQELAERKRVQAEERKLEFGMKQIAGKDPGEAARITGGRDVDPWLLATTGSNPPAMTSVK